MNFELTISGLNIIVLKSAEDRPTKPDAVDIICPAADMHRPRISYAPEEWNPARQFYPELVVGRSGERIGTEDCRDHYYEIAFVSDLYTRKFNLKWAPPPYHEEPLTEEYMDWLPSLDDLGFMGLEVGTGIPDKAAARFSLPPGDVMCREMTRDHSTNETLLWNFPSAHDQTGRICALANLIVYRATDIQAMMIIRDRKMILTSFPNTGTLRMCLSNDMANVPYDYNSPQKSLEHLGHLSYIVDEKYPFVAPFIHEGGNGGQRTGHPICNGVIFVDKKGGS